MIEVQALGGLEVRRDGKRLPALPSQPQRAALLTYLALEHCATREQLCFLLWPDRSPDRARHALSQTLYELKKDLGDTWLQVSGDEVRMGEELSVDVEALDAALLEGEHRQAIRLYRGPFLAGVTLGGGVEFERWVEATQTRLHRSIQSALREVHAKETDPGERIDAARAWVDHDPLDDEAQHALIAALGSAGRRAEALDQYARYKALILAELEVEPLEQTVNLVERIKGGDLAETGAHQTHPAPSSENSGPETTALQTPATPAPRLVIAPDLVVLRLIGQGTTGSVYLAREPSLKRLVAVKVLSDELAEHETARARFEREAQAAARVRHTNVAAVFRTGTAPDGRPYFVMPYIKGVTLADRIKAHGAFSAGEARAMLAVLADALAAAHQVEVVHRDVRPANVLWEERTGRIYLSDFGTAGVLESGSDEIIRLTQTGELLGNPEYISPEQRRGSPVDGRSDVYSLGVLGKELLLGRRSGASEVQKTLPIEDPDLRKLLDRAVAERPSHRPSARELATALAARATESRPPQGLVGRLRERRLLPIIGGYLAAGIAGMGGLDQLVQQDLLPTVTYRIGLATFLAGLNATIVLGWFHGKKGRQAFSRTEILLLALVVLAWGVAIALIV
ncbi:MAG: protein kinase [Gemmatimonadetes bacterium]|nr:protein kinase [Gemmatimonadota bacterium]